MPYDVITYESYMAFDVYDHTLGMVTVRLKLGGNVVWIHDPEVQVVWMTDPFLV
jgi:hypothetical protein